MSSDVQETQQQIMRRKSWLRRACMGVFRRWRGTIVAVKTSEPLVALTFDDGPDPHYTPRIADLMERFGARGTFFMLGEQAAAYPQIVRRIGRGGHAIGNHTWDHPRLPEIERSERLDQLRRTHEAIAPYDAHMFRPPYGGQSQASHLDALRLRYQIVTWSAHIEDWLIHDAHWIAEHIEQALRPGRIILLHDRLQNPRVPAAADRTALIEGLQMVFERTWRFYRFVTVPELLRHGSPVRVHWYRPAR